MPNDFGKTVKLNFVINVPTEKDVVALLQNPSFDFSIVDNSLSFTI